MQKQWDGVGGFGRQVHHEVHAGCVGRLSEMPYNALADRRAVEGVGDSFYNFECGFRRAFGHSAIDIRLVKLKEFGSALFEPGIGVAHGLSVLEK